MQLCVLRRQIRPCMCCGATGLVFKVVAGAVVVVLAAVLVVVLVLVVVVLAVLVVVANLVVLAVHVVVVHVDLVASEVDDLVGGSPDRSNPLGALMVVTPIRGLRRWIWV